MLSRSRRTARELEVDIAAKEEYLQHAEATKEAALKIVKNYEKPSTHEERVKKDAAMDKYREAVYDMGRYREVLNMELEDLRRRFNRKAPKSVASSRKSMPATKKVELDKKKKLLKLQNQFDDEIADMQLKITLEKSKPKSKKKEENLAKLELERKYLEDKLERGKKQIEEEAALESEEIELEEEGESFDEEEREVINKFQFTDDNFKRRNSQSDDDEGTSVSDVAVSSPSKVNDADPTLMDKNVILMTLMQSKLSFLQKSTASNSEKFLPEFSGDQLEDRFGRAEFVLDYLVEKAKESRKPDIARPETIVDFGTSVQALVTSITSYKRPSYMYNTQLVRELIEKLPGTMKGSWFRFLADDDKREPNLEQFSLWLKKQVKAALLQIKPTVGAASEAKSEEKGSSSRSRRNLGSLHASVGDDKEEKSDKSVKVCPCCGKKGHELDQCWSLKKKTSQDLWKVAKEARACFCCLKSHHVTSDCPDAKECGKDGCKRRHHPLLHYKARARPAEQQKDDKQHGNQGAANEEDQVEGYTGLSAAIISGTDGPLPIVPVRVMGPGGTRKVYALLDSGCTRTLITSSLAEYLELEGPTIQYRHRVMQGGIVEMRAARKVNFSVSGCFKNARSFQVTNAITIGTVGLAPYSLDLDKAKKKWMHLTRYKEPSLKSVIPKIVVGGDHGFITMDLDLLYVSEDKPVGRRTALGWYLQGKLADTNTVGAAFHLSGEALDQTLDQLIVESFQLDEYGESENDKLSLSKEDERALAIFEETTRQREDGRWETGLPYKNSEPFPKNAYMEALSRLRKTEARMKKSPEFAKLYQGKFAEYAMKRFIQKLSPEEAAVTSSRTCYLPHFGVVNPHKPGKFRLVFDCAAKVEGKSFNDYLLTGPDLIRPITAILWNFRRHRIVIYGDIEDMFHRVFIREKDRQSQRFLWRDGDESRAPDVYEMQVMIFGAASSPACAIFVKDKNAKKHQDVFPQAVDAIVNSMYVDDLLFGAETVPEAVKLRGEIMGICGRGGFMIKKWISNSEQVMNSIPEAVRLEVGPRGIGETERVLGLYWNPEEDVFTFRINFAKVKTEVLEGRKPKKREMCSLIMSLFDPLGFVAHFKINGLIIFQSTWRLGVDWDDRVPDEVYYDWRNWVSKLKELEGLKIPRCYSSLPVVHVQLHTFVDSSAEASCAVCYFRLEHEDGSVTVTLVGAKTRVAPKKKLTIPRLELCAALLGSQLSEKIKNEVKVQVNKCVLWSDSATVLSWISSESARFKEYVANRVSKIQKLTKIDDWRWIPTAENVADEGTRLRRSADISSESRWIRGPDFLRNSSEEWPQRSENDEIGVTAAAVVEECLGDASGVSPSSDEGCGLEAGEVIPKIERFSSYHRLVRASAAVIAPAQYWIGKVRGVRRQAPWRMNGTERESILRTADVLAAEKFLLRAAQKESKVAETVQRNRKLSSFEDKDGLIRLKGRLGQSVPAEVRSPIVLPARHHLVELMIALEHEKNGHSGRNTVFNELRQKYFLLDGRHAVRRCWSTCMSCRLRKVKPVIPEMGMLPSHRVAAYDPPFTYTGCDLFGPMEVTVGRHHEKRWGFLFTCMVTRGVHLELINGLSLDETMLGLCRFVDCRGLPRHFYSDNGTNFQAIAKEVVQRKKFHGADWHFMPPASPHMGGAWETMVKQVKKVLGAVLKEKFPRDQTLVTALKAVENVVNSRPLSYVSSDPDDPESLTPNHFLRGIGVASSGAASQEAKSGSEYFGEELSEDRERLRKLWEKAQVTANKFWERWSKEVLPNLLRRNKWNAVVEPLVVGDIVIVVDDLKPRNEWNKAVITRVFPAEDGSVRKCEVSIRNFETKTLKTYLRAVAKVCPTGLRVGDLATGSSQIRGPENGEDS